MSILYLLVCFGDDEPVDDDDLCDNVGDAAPEAATTDCLG